MLSYDAPMPANKGHKDAPSALAVSTAASTASSTATTSNASTANTSPTTAHKHHHIWLVTGPAGCGKTTVASHLASNLDMPYIEGDTV
jgi:gluconokinase